MKALALLRMDLRQCRWMLLFLLGALCCLCLVSLPYQTIPMPGGNSIVLQSSAFVWIQLFPCITLCILTVVQYEETFRTPPREYLQTLHVSKCALLVLRPLLMITMLALFYVPLSIHAAEAINISAATNLQYLPPKTVVPKIVWQFVYLQCVPALLLCLTLTLLLECITRSKAVTLILVLTWFGLEAGGIYAQIGSASIFHNAFTYLSLTDGADKNTYLALIASGIFYILMLTAYRPFVLGKWSK